MELAVPAAERQWVYTTAQPAASPDPCYEACLFAVLPNEQNSGNSFAALYLLLL